MKKYVIQDTLEAYLKQGEQEFFFGLTTAGNISKSVSQEQLKAGIGNKTFFVLSIDDGMTVSVTTGLSYAEVYEIQTGQVFEAATDLKWNKVVEASDGTLTITPVETAAGDILDFKAGTFPKVVNAEFRTIAYDIESGEVAADIIYVFPKLMPDGNLSEEFGAGANKTQEINFTALVDIATNSYGKMLIIPRVVTP